MRSIALSNRVRIAVGAVAVVLLGWSSMAAAEKKRVGVPKFEGAQEAVVRKAVMQVLKGDGYDVVGAGEINSAAKSAGADLDSNDGFKTVAKELSISAFVTGDVQKKKAKLVVRNGADGGVSGEGAFGGANVNKIAADVRDGFSRRLGSAVERGRAPSGAKKPSAPPVAEKDDADESDAKPARTTTASKNDRDDKDDKSDNSDKAEKADSSEKSGSDEASSAPTSADETVARSAPAADGGDTGPRAMELALGIGGYSRNLSFNQDIYGQLRQYKLPLGPVLDLHGVVYPAAFSTAGFVANIGIEGHIQQGFGTTSSTPNNSTFNTTVHDYYGGARLRFILGGVHEVAVMAGGGEQAFAFVNGTAQDGTAVDHLSDIPDTVYRYGRAGVDARFQIAPGVTLGVGGGYRYIFNRGGQIGEAPFFPYLTVGGVDLDGTLAYMLTPSIELRVALGLKRYFFNMNSTPADAGMPNMIKVAGGAVDQYIGGTIGAAYVFGGVPAGAVHASDEPPAAEEAPPAAEEAAPAPAKKKKKKAASDDEDDEGAANGSDG
jgi:hypothetical protein